LCKSNLKVKFKKNTKYFARVIIHLLVKISNPFLGYKIIEKFKSFIKEIYSVWISQEFKKIGKEVQILPKLYLKGGEYISIGDGTSLGANGYLTAWDHVNNEQFVPSISIGNNCSIGSNFHITSINCIHIGNSVLTGKYLTISDNSHGCIIMSESQIQPIKRKLYSKGSVKIGNNIWIGDKVTILPNVEIGDGAIIGANSVVTSNVPANVVYAGNPAKLVKILQ
jgi:acetyltransferase-like isoleucine patch superfamily enzyme